VYLCDVFEYRDKDSKEVRASWSVSLSVPVLKKCWRNCLALGSSTLILANPSTFDANVLWKVSAV
jgi:hypothetical protein